MVANVTDLLDRMWEAAVIPELWRGVIERLSVMAGGSHGGLVAISNQTLRFVATENYAQGFDRYFAQRDFEHNVRPARALARRHQGFLRDIDLCTPEELKHDLIYDKYLRPAGVGWTVGTVIPVPGGDMLVFEVGRHPHVGPFDLGEVAILDSFRPHLARSAHLASRLGLAQAQSAAAALAVVGLPAAVMKADKRVVAVNDLFEALAPRVTTTAQNRLAIADAKANRLIQSELEKSRTGDDWTVRSIPVPASDEEPPLIVHLTPVRRAAHDIFGQAHWIAVVTPVAASGSPDVDVLQGLFDLTAAEARVTRQLLEGSTVSSIAADNAVSSNTIRSQIRSVFAKTGVSRQTDLMTLLSGSILRQREQ
jgi:DNA-binding CsgD family transcriptional regulator